ncbi:MAG: ABC transporter permease subunit [Oscillospiraceae bacterium]
MAKVKSNKIKSKKFTFDDLELVLLSLPTVIWYALFSFLPMFGVLLSFKQYKLSPGKGFFGSFFESKWVGFEKFKFLFARDDMGAIFGKTIGYNLIFIALGVVIPVALAIMISNLYSQKIGKVCQTAMFLPHFMSWVVASYFVFAFLSPEQGLVTRIMANAGVENFNFYGTESLGLWPVLIIILNIWKTTGYGMVVYLASITGIDSTYYEAAVIDGATKWQQVKKITLPLLKPIIIIMAIMAVGRIFNSDFGLFYQATKNSTSLYPATQTLDVLIYNMLSKSSDFSMASAAALFQSVAGCFTILFANWVVTKVDSENAFF